MTWIPFSSFDPIFFLHHCMVDRLFAMWQVLYPDTWVEPTPAAMASYTTAKGQIQDSKTALTPFFASTDGTFWTSDTVRDPTVFGYTYQEIAGYSVTRRAGHTTARSQVIAAINNLYGSYSPASLSISESRQRRAAPSARRPSGGSGRHISTEDGKKAVERDQESPPPTGRPPPGTIVVSNKYREWVANVRMERQGLDSSFFVHMFLGEPPTSSKGWPYAPNLVGTMSAFASPGMGKTEVMGRRLMSGTVPLTAALMKEVVDGRLPCLDAEVVQPYLQRNLEFRVLRTDGTVVNPSVVPGLGIRVVSSEVQAPTTDEELPYWGQAVYHFDLI